MSDDYSGEKFLDRLFKDLFSSPEVQHGKFDKQNHAKAIRTYMNRLERVHGKAKTERKKELLKSYYYKKYVINESYLYRHTDEGKQLIIKAQKKSLDAWIDYLSDENARYPMWAKYWAFQGMLKLGTYDVGHGTYQRRSEVTTAPFVEANPTVIAACILAMMNYVKYKKTPEGDDIEKPLKSGSFKKLYEYYSKKFKRIKITNSGNEGIWIKYNYKNEEDAKKLYDSLQGKGTGWCTEAEFGYAKSQVCGGESYPGGDFYVYYTPNQDGEMTLPRIAIRMNGTDRIGEIRGIEDYQNLETDMIPILEKKLNEMTDVSEEDREENIEVVNGLKLLTDLYKKTVKKEQLSTDIIVKLYTTKFGFGWQQDPMFNKVVALRDLKADFYSVDNEYAKNSIAKLYIENSKTFHYSVEDFLKDKEIFLFAIRCDIKYMYVIPKALLADKNFVIEALGYCSEIYRKLSDDLKEDKDVIIAALNSGLDFYLIPDEKKKDRDVAVVAIKYHASVFDYLDESFKDDKEIVLLTLEGTNNIYSNISDRLRSDKDVCLATLALFPYEYQIMPVEIKEDKEFIKIAIVTNKYVYEYLPDSIKEDKEITEIALTVDAWIYRYLPEKLKTDKEFITKMIGINPQIFEYVRDMFDKEEKIRLIREYPEIVEYLADEDIYDRDILAVAIEVRPEDYKEILDEMRFSTDFDETYTEETYKAELYFKSVYDEVMGRKKFKDIPEKEGSKEEKPVSVVIQNMEPEEDPGMKL